MNENFKKVIKSLDKLSDSWPKDIMLFAAAGSLLLVEVSTKKIIKEFPGILCDGGDLGSAIDEDGNEYITIDEGLP